MSIKLTPRKAPRQPRAKATVQAMIEAALRLTESKGAEAWTTNEVAQIAGVSIGTLYQYFPSKESLVTALAHDRREQRLVAMQTTLEGASAAAPGATVAAALVELYGPAQKVEADLDAYLATVGAGRKLVPLDTRAAKLVASYVLESSPHVTPRLASLLGRAAVACVVTTAAEARASLADPAFCREIACLVDGTIRESARLEGS